MSFDRPEVLVLLVLLPLLLRRPRPVPVAGAPFRFAPDASRTDVPARKVVRRLLPLPRALRMLGVAGLVVVGAGPVRLVPSRVPAERSVAVMLVVDVSGSMREGPSGGTPLDRTRAAALDLLAASPGYRVGLVTFAANALTRMPPTDDPAALRAAFESIEAGVQGGGSAVGTALGLAVERLAAEDAAARVAILVSDGIDNAGPVSPAGALDLAREANVEVHMLSPRSEGPPAARATMDAIRALGGTVATAGAAPTALRDALAARVPPRPAPGPPVRRPANGWVALAGVLLLASAVADRTRLGGIG